MIDNLREYKSKVDFYIRSYKTLDVYFICDTRISRYF